MRKAARVQPPEPVGQVVPRDDPRAKRDEPWPVDVDRIRAAAASAQRAQQSALDAPRYIFLLSRREQQVLRLRAEGLSNEEVGETLGVTARSIKSYLSSAYTKLDANSLVDAVVKSGLYLLNPECDGVGLP